MRGNYYNMSNSDVTLQDKFSNRTPPKKFSPSTFLGSFFVIVTASEIPHLS